MIAAPGADDIPGLVFAPVTALEYGTYLHVQVMDDNPADLGYLFTRGPRRTHLARDLRTRGTPRRAWV